MLSAAWGISEREVQRTLGRGVPGFRRVGRGHYRVVGPITAERLRRVRLLDPRLPVAVWISGDCTLWGAARLCSGGKIVEAIRRAQPHMRQARVVLLALETRMAREYKSTRREYYLRRQETAVVFSDYRQRIEPEVAMAEVQPMFVEAANSARRLINNGVTMPTRSESAADLGISERTHYQRYRRGTWRRALDAGASNAQVKEPTGILLGAMERLGGLGLDCSTDEVAEELGYGSADTMFNYFTREEYKRALRLFEKGTIASSASVPDPARAASQVEAPRADAEEIDRERAMRTEYEQWVAGMSPEELSKAMAMPHLHKDIAAALARIAKKKRRPT